MEDYNEILGFVEIDNISHPFHFSSESFDLLVYPPTVERWQENRDSLLMEFSKQHHRTFKWIGKHKIKGITARGHSIVFCVSDSFGSNNGFITYRVEWVVCHSKQDYSIDQINGLRITGGDINYFYPAYKALKPHFTHNADYSYKTLQVSSTSQDYLSCGKYRVVPHIDAAIQINSYATIHFENEKNPIDAESNILVNYSRPVTIDVVIQTINDLFLFFVYTCYRSNISFPTIEVFWLNQNKKRDFNGRVLMSRKCTPEVHERIRERIIPYDFWGTRTSRMLTTIKNGKLDFEHLCDSISEQKSYPHSRFILILAEFEREFRNIYGTDYNRSKMYTETKAEVMQLLNELSGKKTGKSKQYVKSLVKSISNLDNSYSLKVKQALNDCIDIMRPFIEREYDSYSPKVIDGIAIRSGELRNGFVHSRLDLKLEAIHLADIQIIEELVYAMRLKLYERDSKKVQSAISRLFGKRI